MARLVVLGDSLAIGGRSFAVSNTNQSFPALLAAGLGLSGDEFRTPDFSAHGGLPFNLEWIARRLEETYGHRLRWFSWPTVAMRIVDWLHEVRQGWRQAPPQEDVLYHNLALWGCEVKGAWSVTPTLASLEARWRPDDAMHWPAHATLQIAQRVLNPSGRPERNDDTMVDVAARIAEQEGGIDHLVVALGANNCLRSVVELAVREPSDIEVPIFSDFTLWSEEAFAYEYRTLCDRLAPIGARHVYLSTVPHASASPLLTGLMDQADARAERYYDRYVHIPQAGGFNAGQAHLTGAQLQALDQRIDHFNRVIRRAADSHGWEVVDIGGLFDDLASERRHAILPAELSDLSMDILALNPDGTLARGGLMSLDGFHPTACCSALVAKRFMDAVGRHEAGLTQPDWAAVRASDTLVSRPPGVLSDLADMVATLEGRLGVSRFLTRWTRVAATA